MANEKSKTVKMDAQKGNVENPGKQEKMTYEQLEQLAGNLNRQCQQFYQQLQEANRVISDFNEIGMLLDILGRSEHFSDSFVTRCAQKIEKIVGIAFDKAEEAEKANQEAQ